MPNQFLKGLTLLFSVVLVSAFVLFRCGALNPEAENILSLPAYDHITGIGGNDTISFGDSIQIHRRYISSTKSGMIFDFDHPAYEDFMQEGIVNGFVVLDTLNLDKRVTLTISIDSIYFDPMFYGSKSGKIFEPTDSSFLNDLKKLEKSQVEIDKALNAVKPDTLKQEINGSKPKLYLGSSKSRFIFDPSDLEQSLDSNDRKEGENNPPK